MNLHAIVRGAITSVNPDEELLIYQSAEGNTGWGAQEYGEAISVSGQCQNLGGADITQVDGVTVNTDDWRFYIATDTVRGVDRYTARSGDIIERSDGRKYLVTAVNDDFRGAGWVCVRGTLQND